jgi:hypothetical protein
LNVAEVIAMAGERASVVSCWAVRTSLVLAEIPIPTQIDQAAKRGVKAVGQFGDGRQGVRQPARNYPDDQRGQRHRAGDPGSEAAPVASG